MQHHRAGSGVELELLLLPAGKTCGKAGVVELGVRLAAYICSCVGKLMGYCAALASSGLAAPAGLGTLVATFGGDALNGISVTLDLSSWSEVWCGEAFTIGVRVWLALRSFSPYGSEGVGGALTGGRAGPAKGGTRGARAVCLAKAILVARCSFVSGSRIVAQAEFLSIQLSSAP